MQSSPHILVIDDDARICRLLERYLSEEGFQVSSAVTAADGREKFTANDLDLVILDLMLPDESGLSLARELRSTSDIPIVMLTGKTDTVDKIVGLELGADDYITKPFEERELLARIRSVIRRSKNERSDNITGQKSIACFAGWELDLTAHTLTAESGEEVPLTSYEFLLLETLAESPNRIFSRSQLLDKIAGRDSFPYDRSIDVLVGKTRKKLGEDPKTPKLIKTVRGSGYMLTTSVDFK